MSEMTVCLIRCQVIKGVAPGTGGSLLCLLSVLVSFPVAVIKLCEGSDLGERGFVWSLRVKHSPLLLGAKAAGVWSSRSPYVASRKKEARTLCSAHFLS